MKTKICTRCGKEKELKEFYKDKSRKDGLFSRCKECVKEYKKEYYQNKKEEIKEKSSLYYLKNIEKKKIYRDNNKVKTIKYQKEWYKENKKRLTPIRTKYQKDRKQTDIKFKIRCNLRTRTCNALKRKSKSLSTMFLIGCDRDYLMYHLQEQFTKGMSWDNYGVGGWEMDHIKPCAKFDLSKESEQRACFNYKNLQPLWAIDNRRKRDKTDTVFATKK